MKTHSRGPYKRTAPRAPATFIAGMVAVMAIVSAFSVADAQQTGDGFFFRPSPGQLLIHGGFAHARSRSGVFDFTIDNLTVDRGDFSSFEGGLEFSAHASSRISVTLGFDYSKASQRSEFREWEDNEGLPIEQTTTFTRVPVMLGMKAYIIPPGQSVGLLAWVPNTFAPFVAGGFGLLRYKFDQDGDWVDFQDFSVFTDSFHSSGGALMTYLGAGVDVSLNERFGITTELRRIWSSGQHSDDFVGFDDIDLSGTTLKAGLFIRF